MKWNTVCTVLFIKHCFTFLRFFFYKNLKTDIFSESKLMESEIIAITNPQLVLLFFSHIYGPFCETLLLKSMRVFRKFPLIFSGQKRKEADTKFQTDSCIILADILFVICTRE